MTIVRFGCLAAVVSIALASCASEDRQVDGTKGMTSMQPAAPTVRDQGWAALVEADREIKDLASVRDQTADAARRQAIELEMTDLRSRSDKLLDDMTIGDGRVHDVAVRDDVAKLHRAMHAHAVTEMQGQ